MNERNIFSFTIKGQTAAFRNPRLVVLLLLGGLGILLVLLSNKPALQTNKPVLRSQKNRRTSEVGQTAHAVRGTNTGSTPRAVPAINPAAAEVLKTHFPQTQRCNYDKWGLEYAKLHADIVSGRAAPRYLVSVAGYNGLADRMTGLVTQFYLALLSRRAFTMVTHSYLPPLSAACAQPFVNWTHPQVLPSEVLSRNFVAHDDYSEPDQLPPTGQFNSSTNFRQSMMNTPKTPAWLRSTNLSLFPYQNPEVPYVMSLSNRGDTSAVFNNPHHKQQWSSEYGLTPETAFMCSWFYLCAPSTPVQALYHQTWSILQDAKALKIGIKVRLGDQVFRDQHNETLGEEQLQQVMPYFECARLLEQAFAAPGQRVVWYLIADALPLRVAAAKRFSTEKLLTDTTSAAWHTDCFVFNPKACDKKTMERTTQEALGEMLAFSMTDYQIMPKGSGFSRVGAWLSGKPGNSFEFDLNTKPDLSAVCDPHKPTPPQESASTWSRI